MSSKSKRPEEIIQILNSRIKDAKYFLNLDALASSQNWSANGLNKQVDKLSYLCDLIQEENKIIKFLLDSVESYNQPPIIKSPITNSKPILGIDLGTSRSTVGYYKINARGRSELEIVANQKGSRSNPSVICIYKNKIYFGDEAIKISSKCPENLIYDSKRMLGHKFNDNFIQYMRKYWTFNTCESQKGDILIEVEKRYYQPYEISSMILIELMKLANDHLKEKTNQAIITVPAYFTKEQRDETKKAAEAAGIKLLDLVEEPKAATFCYGFKTEDVQNAQKNRDIVVYDFGGGTLDVSYVEIKGNSFNVLCMDGDPFIGGQDFTNCIYEYISSEVDKVCKSNWRNDIRFVSYVKNQCDEAKIYLSDQNDYDFEFDIPPKLQKNDSVFELNITRKQFENAAKNLFDRCMNPVSNVLKKVNRDPRKIDGLVLIGGSSYLPKIRNKLKELTQKDAFHGVCPVEAVAYGACIIAANFLQGSMPQYNINGANSDRNEKFLSNMTVNDKSASKERCQTTIEIEKYKDNAPYYEIVIEEGVILPTYGEVLVLSNEVQIPKNSKEVSLRIFKNPNKRTYLGSVKFDTSHYRNISSQISPVICIKLVLTKSGLMYSTKKPSSSHWSTDKQLEIIENSNFEKKKNDSLNDQEITPIYRTSSEQPRVKDPITLVDPKQAYYEIDDPYSNQNYMQTNYQNELYQQQNRQQYGYHQNQGYANTNDQRHETFPEQNHNNSNPYRPGFGDQRYQKS